MSEYEVFSNSPPHVPPVPPPQLTIFAPHEWGGLPFKEGAAFEPMTHPVKNVIFSYYTDTDPCETVQSCKRTVRELQQRYRDQGHPDLPYNFLVGGDLNIYEARGWDIKPVKHAKFPDCHDSSVEIAFIGNYRKDTLRYAMVRASMDLVGRGVANNNVTKGYALLEPVPKLNFPVTD